MLAFNSAETAHSQTLKHFRSFTIKRNLQHLFQGYTLSPRGYGPEANQLVSPYKT